MLLSTVLTLYYPTFLCLSLCVDMAEEAATPGGLNAQSWEYLKSTEHYKLQYKVGSSSTVVAYCTVVVVLYCSDSVLSVVLYCSTYSILLLLAALCVSTIYMTPLYYRSDLTLSGRCLLLLIVSGSYSQPPAGQIGAF